MIVMLLPKLRVSSRMAGFLLAEVTFSIVAMVLLCHKDTVNSPWHQRAPASVSRPGEVEGGKWRNLSRQEMASLSVLGRRLFLEEDVGSPRKRNFTILVWRPSEDDRMRFFHRYGEEEVDHFDGCSVRNCRVTTEESAALTSDAVYIHFHATRGPHDFPARPTPRQVWIWHSDESPVNALPKTWLKDLTRYNGFFNWSMTYLMDSDVPVPYGRTLALTDAERNVGHLPNYYDTKPKMAAVMMSNCERISNSRRLYIKILQRHMDVDFYGKCGDLSCPGHFTKDCQPLDKYKFYLAFENSNCREYITEKVWWNALGKGSIPVVMGGDKQYYSKTLPPESFIHIDDFDSPQDLARRLQFLASNPHAYIKYHQWRRYFRVVQEHGYFGAPLYHYCRICEALNYNDLGPKACNSMEKYWGVGEKQCQSPKWVSRYRESVLNLQG